MEPALGPPGEQEEGEVASGELAAEIVAVGAIVLDRHHQRAGVVVGGVSGPVVWDRMASVLYDAEGICQTLQVFQRQGLVGSVRWHGGHFAPEDS